MANEYALLGFDVGRIEADRGSTFNKKAYFFTSYAYAIAALDDGDDISDATGIVTLKRVDLTTGIVAADDYAYDPYVVIASKYVKVDENATINVAFAAAADMYMILPDAAGGVQPIFIPSEMLVLAEA